jgi:hypothetical protein
MTYSIFLYTFGDALNDVLHNISEVSFGLIIPEPHHSPVVLGHVPVHFYNTIIDLFARRFHSTQLDTMRLATMKKRMANSPLPFLVCDVHLVIRFVSRCASFVATIHM